MLAPLFSGLVTAAVLLRWLSRLSLSRRSLAVMLVVVLGWSLLPWPLGLHGWLEGYFGYFSVTTALVALAALTRRLGGPTLIPEAQMRGLCLVVVAVAVWFYPMSLGATVLDPYAPGYGDFRFSSALLLLGLLAWLLRAWSACVILALGQLAYGAQLMPSNNLWDYLLDPWLTFFAFGWLIRDGRRTLRARRAVQPASE